MTHPCSNLSGALVNPRVSYGMDEYSHRLGNHEIQCFVLVLITHLCSKLSSNSQCSVIIKRVHHVYYSHFDEGFPGNLMQ